MFQNVLVLSVGTRVRGASEKESASRRKAVESAPKEDAAPLITLSLSPEEANILAFVKEQGKIQLILRSPGDAQTKPVQPTSWATVLKYLFPQIDLEAREKRLGRKKNRPRKRYPRWRLSGDLKRSSSFKSE